MSWGGNETHRDPLISWGANEEQPQTSMESQGDGLLL